MFHRRLWRQKKGLWSLGEGKIKVMCLGGVRGGKAHGFSWEREWAGSPPKGF